MPRFKKAIYAPGLYDGANRAYSDSNPPETLMMTKYASAVSTPPSGQIVLYSADGSVLAWKDDAGVVRTAGGGTKTSDLPAATVPLTGAEIIPIVQGGVTKRVTAGDLVPVPWVESTLFAVTNTTFAFSASTAANTEIFSGSRVTRRKLDLSWATQIRATALVGVLGNSATASLKVSYCTVENATWASGTGVADAGASVVLGSNGGAVNVMHDSGWQTLAAGARADNITITMLCGVAFGTTAPSVSNFMVYFR